MTIELNLRVNTIVENLENKLTKYIKENLEGDEYLVCDEQNRDIEVKDYIENSLWAFNTDFIIEHSNINNSTIKSIRKMQEELCEDANEIIKELITDIDEFIEDAVEADGYAHFLSPYDEEEIEIDINGITYYLYRLN